MNYFKAKYYRTESLDMAALLRTFGATLTYIGGKYPNNTFSFKVPYVVVWYIKHIGWVPYEKYVKLRQDIKKQIRIREGLPPHFTGEGKGFTFMDLAHLGQFTKHELENLKK